MNPIRPILLASLVSLARANEALDMLEADKKPTAAPAVAGTTAGVLRENLVYRKPSGPSGRPAPSIPSGRAPCFSRMIPTRGSSISPSPASSNGRPLSARPRSMVWMRLLRKMSISILPAPAAPGLARASAPLATPISKPPASSPVMAITAASSASAPAPNCGRTPASPTASSARSSPRNTARSRSSPPIRTARCWST